MEHDDDRPIGHVLSRREALTLFGAAGVLLLPACGGRSTATSAATTTSPATSTTAAAVATTTTTGAATQTQVAAPSCIARPAIEEGPFFVDEKLNRSDVRTDPSDGSLSPGTPLTLTFRLARLSGTSCTALAGAMIDIWSASAAGTYSDEGSEGTSGKKYLRGFQTTDANGAATFTTVYPGWYQGRTVHLHVKIRPTAGQALTTQLFFDDALSDKVFAQAPYSGRGQRDTRNSTDRIFTGQGGSQMVLALTPDPQGFAGAFDIGLQM
jgi:protocatechuate 3,4-dioxygenase beta subunit